MPPSVPGSSPDRPLLSHAIATPAAEMPFPASLRAPTATWPLTGHRTLVLAIGAVVLMAATFRLQGLDYGGFSEDEIHKVTAVRAYASGDLTANAEHPMLMKLAMLGTTSAAGVWNGLAARAGWSEISPEAALRLPNALAGAAIVVPLFLLTRSFFGPLVALWASLLLALDVTVTGLNRIGKEDTFLVFFLLLGTWLYEEARARHAPGGAAPSRWYAAAGAAFGLMLASKYMIYYLGLWALFRLAAGAEERKQTRAPAPATPGPSRRAPRSFYLATAVAFVVANPVILWPPTWAYLLHYTAGGTMTHHGAYFAGRIYPNAITDTPWGLPWHFYLLFLAVKIPLLVLAAIAVGVVELVRRRRHRGAVFARVFLLFFLLPSSLAASKFARYLLPTLVVLQVVAALGIVRSLDLVARWRHPRLRVAASGALVALVVVSALTAQVSAAPFASLYLNAIGRSVAAPGTLFPNDEVYDMGVREAVRWIAAQAGPGASIASDAPGVVGEYLRRAGRPDIEARPLSTAGLPMPPAEAWLLAQNSHACFESQPMVDQVRARHDPDFVYRVHGTAAVEAFHLDLGGSATKLRRRQEAGGAQVLPVAWTVGAGAATRTGTIASRAVLREAHYSLAGRVRPLLFWIGKDGVGEARIAWLAGPDEFATGYELLVGSDPARAPRKINRWGYIAETESAGEVQVVGLMTEVDHETLEQAKASAEGPSEGSRAYKVIRGVVAPPDADATVRGVMLPDHLTFKDLDVAMQSVPAGGPPERRIAVPQGAEPGFLHAVASLLREQVSAYRQSGAVPPGGARAYVYGGRVYDVTIRSSKPVARAVYKGHEFRDLIESEFQARSRSGSGGSRFKLAYGTDGPLREVPVRIVYRPKWWFEAEMVLVDAEGSGPGVTQSARARSPSPQRGHWTNDGLAADQAVVPPDHTPRTR